MSTSSDKETAVVAKGDFSPHAKRRKLLMGVAILIALAVIAGVVIYLLNKQSNDDKLKQASLQRSLTTAENLSNDKDIISYATQLIDGAKKGSYVIPKSALSNMYLARATSYLNEKQYTKATPDFNQAGKLDGENEKAALQGEIQARHKLGQKKELIPLLQKLIAVTKKSSSPMASSSITQYQGSIDRLQKGQDIEF